MPTTATTLTVNSRLWLCLPALACYCLDVTLTLAGQSAEYWGGDYSRVIELNPLARVILAWHPLAFVVFAVAWAGVVAAVLLLWRSSFVVVLTFLMSLLHAVGAAGWLVRYGVGGSLLALALLVAAERLLTLSWARAGVLPNNT